MRRKVHVKHRQRWTLSIKKNQRNSCDLILFLFISLATCVTFTLEIFYLLWLTEVCMIRRESPTQGWKWDEMKWKEERKVTIFVHSIKTIIMMCVTLCLLIYDTFYTHRYQLTWMDDHSLKYNKWPNDHVNYWYSSNQSIKLFMYLLSFPLTRDAKKRKEMRCISSETTASVIELLPLYQWILCYFIFAVSSYHQTRGNVLLWCLVILSTLTVKSIEI